ncbi:MAG TPA: glycosyltransferase family 87 protein, partial [Oligoflexia bacterium]|nr:glycosyltransferase family 87 protein [Oligoflexia bacterium]
MRILSSVYRLMHACAAGQRKRLLRAAAALLAGFFLGMLALSLKVIVTAYRDSGGIVLPNKQFVGGDFAAFYTAGKIVRENRFELYDFEVQRRMQSELGAKSGAQNKFLPFCYPPLVALLVAPLAEFSLLHAFYVWLILSVFLFLSGSVLAARSLKIPLGASLFFLLAAFSFQPLIMDSLAGGQASCLGFFIGALVLFFLKNKNDAAAGVCLALSYYKPPLFALYVVFLLLDRRWKMLAGFCGAGALLVWLSVLFAGLEGIRELIFRGARYTYAGGLPDDPTFMLREGAGLFALCEMLSFAPRSAQAVSCAAALLIIIFIRQKLLGGREDAGRLPVELVFALQFSVSIFLSPHVLMHDLVLVLLPVLIAAVHLVRFETGAGGVCCVLSMFFLYFAFLFPEV